MMVLRLSEFGRYCYERNVRWYIFSTGNQSQVWYPFGMAIRFSSIYVGLQPNRISLLNDSRNRICFESVKEVRIDESVPGSLFKFDVVCVDEVDNEVSYTVLAE